MLKFKQWLNESFDYKEERYDYLDGKQYDIWHSAQVTPHHTLVVKHTIQHGRGVKKFMDTDFGFIEPDNHEYSKEMITSSHQLKRPIPREHVMKVMSTVAKSTEETIKKHGIYKTGFYANSDRKDQTYKKAARRIAARLGGKPSEKNDMQYITMPQAKKAISEATKYTPSDDEYKFVYDARKEGRSQNSIMHGDKNNPGLGYTNHNKFLNKFDSEEAQKRPDYHPPNSRWQRVNPRDSDYKSLYRLRKAGHPETFIHNELGIHKDTVAKYYDSGEAQKRSDYHAPNSYRKPK